MVTTGAITNRIDRLEERGLVERTTSPTDRRRVIVRLTPLGLDLVQEVAPTHLATEEQILTELSPRARDQLVASLRKVLLSLGDAAADEG